jgi:AcrR family transcriptional regulator
MDIFSARPFDEVSIDDIAAAAGNSKGLLHRLLPSKRDVYVAVIRSAADDMQALTEPDPALPPRERLAAALDRYLAYVETHARGYATVLRAGIGSDPAVAHIVEAVCAAMVARLLADLPVPAGTDAPVALRIAVRGWSGFVEAASLDWLEPGGLSRARLRDMLIAALDGAVSAAAGADPRVPREPVAP